MASGFFAGGMAQRIQDQQEFQQKERAQQADVGLRTRALDIQQQSMQNAQQRDIFSRADKQISDTMSIVGEVIKSGVETGKDPVAIQKAIRPLVDSAKSLASRAGRDPDALEGQVTAQLVQPSIVDKAGAAGTAKAVSQIAEERTLKEAGYDGLGKWKTLDEKVKAEGALRDDYLKASAPFITIRDAKNRIDSVEKTGAGDMALVFNYMKILDPGSTVREGEYATAVNAAGVPSAIQAMYNRAIGGGQLGDEARKQIISQATKIYNAQAVQHDKLSTQFAGIAKRNRLDPDSSVPDLSPVQTKTDKPPTEAKATFDERFTPTGIKFRIVK